MIVVPAMPSLTPAAVFVSDAEREQLEALIRQHHAPQQRVVRARIILLAGQGVGIRASAVRLGIGRTTVQAWRRHWVQRAPASVTVRLADAPRSGTPATFSAEQVCAIMALACEPPSASGRAITHWTGRELAEEAVKRGIVASISPPSVRRFLKIRRPQTASRAGLAQCQARPAV